MRLKHLSEVSSVRPAYSEQVPNSKHIFLVFDNKFMMIRQQQPLIPKNVFAQVKKCD